jgi:hypothetical protein
MGLKRFRFQTCFLKGSNYCMYNETALAVRPKIFRSSDFLAVQHPGTVEEAGIEDGEDLLEDATQTV